MPIPLEICIDSTFAAQAAKAAFDGGASRIELCSQMNLNGLTPSIPEMKEARESFPKSGLMVMIRPRDGNFVYSMAEQKQIFKSIQDAKDAGADSVVFGILEHGSINLEATREIINLAKSLSLSTTFHRAFDAVKHQETALEQLIDLGVDRVLTSGTAWGSKQGALEGLAVIQSLLEQTRERIEIVVGGSINTKSIQQVLQGLEGYKNFSIHAYSGVQENGFTKSSLVKDFTEAIKQHQSK